MTNFLLNKFIGPDPDYKDPTTRERVGFLAGGLGGLINLGLFLLKIFIGLALGSISVVADAFNNLSDSLSSIISIVGFKLSSQPADKEHPYGHGRIEYIAALLIAFMVLLVGFQFIRSSLKRILQPSPVDFKLGALVLLLLSIGLKLWLSFFNRQLAENINSQGLRAAGLDALGDVFTSSVVALSLVLSLFTDLPIDGYIGLLVALLIIYSGYNLVKDTLSPLIGQAPSPELIKAIEEGVLSYEYISGVHDLRVHNYGPTRASATIHAEFPANIDVMDIHQVVDRAERDLSESLNIDLVIHMDPVSLNTEEVLKSKALLKDIIGNYPQVKSYHDFRIIGRGPNRSLIFDLVLDGNLTDPGTEKEIAQKIRQQICKNKPDYQCIIRIDREY